MTESESVGYECPRCQGRLTARTVKTALWHGTTLALVEDIPAQVCDQCSEQFYDDAVSDALRRLAEDGFPLGQAARTESVPVFSLEPLIRRYDPLPEDTFLE